MRQGIERRLGALLLDRVCRSVLQTPPLRTDDASLVFASMVSHGDVLRYLLAIKSIYRFFKQGRIAVLDDGTLTEADHAILQTHLDRPSITPINQVDTGTCPNEGCWERLLKIGSLAKDDYVIQVDSDLLALEPLDEVMDAYKQNASFTQAGGIGEAISDLEKASATAGAWTDDYVGTLAEQALSSIAAPFGSKYVHGSAGFAGFPRGQDLCPPIQAFSAEMSEKLGPKWSQWGSEQTTSNYIVANCPGAVLLDYAHYPLHWEGHSIEQAKLIHFIGCYRYRHGNYRRLAKRVVSELMEDGPR